MWEREKEREEASREIETKYTRMVQHTRALGITQWNDPQLQRVLRNGPSRGILGLSRSHTARYIKSRNGQNRRRNFCPITPNRYTLTELCFLSGAKICKPLLQYPEHVCVCVCVDFRMYRDSVCLTNSAKRDEPRISSQDNYLFYPWVTRSDKFLSNKSSCPDTSSIVWKRSWAFFLSLRIFLYVLCAIEDYSLEWCLTALDH